MNIRDTFRRFISANIIAPDPDPQPSNLDRLDDVTTEHAFGAAASSADEAMTMALGAFENGTAAQAHAILDGYLTAHPLTVEEQAVAATTAGLTPLYDQEKDVTIHMGYKAAPGTFASMWRDHDHSPGRDILGPLGVDPHIFADKVERDLANIPANTIAAIVRGEQ